MNILLFDLSIVGHHAGYIRHLLHYWPDSETTLNMVVSPEFLQEHGDVVHTESVATVTWSPITGDELRWYNSTDGSPLRRAWIEWRLFCRYAKKMNADQGLVMYMDRFQLPFALRLPIPCPLSGIYFRPKFHYAQLTHHRPIPGEWLKSLRERLLWRSALRHPRLKTLFTLDPFAVEPLRCLGGSAHVEHLADPVEIYPSPTIEISLKQTLGIEPQRKVFLLFGILDKRKGIYQIVEGLKQLSESEQSQIALLLIGPLAEPEHISAELHRLQRDTSVQMVIQDHFVLDEQIQPYFEIADVVLGLYQHHVGMSAILVRAAAAGKPVFASDYGLMGELVQRYQLGRAVDSGEPDEIKLGFRKFLASQPESTFDQNLPLRFAQANSPALFTETLWNGLQD